MTHTPDSVNELLEMNNNRKEQEENDTPNMGLLFSQLDKLNPQETAHLIRGLVHKVTNFHEFVVTKRMKDGVNDENVSELGLWILDMKSWRMISQEIENISDFCDDEE